MNNTEIIFNTTQNYQIDLSGTTKVLECKIELENGIIVYALSVNDRIYVAAKDTKYHDWFGPKISKEEVEPFIKIKPVGTIYNKHIMRQVWVQRSHSPYYNSYSGGQYENQSVLDTYGARNDYYDKVKIEGIPYNYLQIEVTSNDGKVALGEIKFTRPQAGIVDIEKATQNEIPIILSLFGTELKWSLSIIKDNQSYYHNRFNKFIDILQKYTIADKAKFWSLFFDDHLKTDIYPTKAVKSFETNKKIAPNISKLRLDEPLLYNFYIWLHHDKVKAGISNNQCLAAFLKECGENYDSLKSGLQEVMDKAILLKNFYEEEAKREFCLMFSAAKQKDEEKRSHKEWYLKKTCGEQAEALGVDKEKYPLLFAAIENQSIPLGIFHNPTDKLNVVNIEFDLWEKALNRIGWSEVLFNIAQNAAGRNTYERDITPYISFLFKIEKYLDKHAAISKNKWKAMPSFVNSEWQLEMDEATEEGTVKKRSALTPVADNDTGTITVPYAAIAVHGRQTTYCYAKHYFVFEEFMLDDESGSVITKDLEVALNGRDDYGLMYYTLTGTHQNRGYPTFLIIFERLAAKTRVHFHRVHPNRYKDGKPTPACRLIEECYRYMAGNIRAEEIYAQQGDLIFIKSEEPKFELEKLAKIKDFESHAFIGTIPIKLLENASKTIKNRLGHIFAEQPFVVEHPEHQDVKMDAGWYEVRRCKSWEANPRAVWSITID